MRKLLVVVVLASAALTILIVETCAQTIYVCVKQPKGTMRYVTGPGMCKTSETEISWPGATFSSNYFEFVNLCTKSINATNTFQKIDDFVTFSKERTDTVVEVILNSRARGGTFGGSATGVVFEVRIDGMSPTVGNQAAVTTSNSIDFISIFSVFDGLVAGQHTVSVWARTNLGTSAGVLLDPGCFGGGIIVKETY